MSLPLFDITLIILVAGFAAVGLWSGLIHALGSLVGVVVGAFMASHYSLAVMTVVEKLTGWPATQMNKWLAFIIVFLLVTKLVGLTFWLAEKFLNIVVHLPFIKSINHICGAAFGFLEGVFLVGLSLFYASQLPVPPVAAFIAQSKTAGYLMDAGKILLPLVPEAIKQAQKLL